MRFLKVDAHGTIHSELLLCFYDGAAILTTIARYLLAAPGHRLEVIVLPARFFIAFRTVTISQLLGRQRQMTMTTAHPVRGLSNQDQIPVITIGHPSHGAGL